MGSIGQRTGLFEVQREITRWHDDEFRDDNGGPRMVQAGAGGAMVPLRFVFTAAVDIAADLMNLGPEFKGGGQPGPHPIFFIEPWRLEPVRQLRTALTTNAARIQADLRRLHQYELTAEEVAQLGRHLAFLSAVRATADRMIDTPAAAAAAAPPT